MVSVAYGYFGGGGGKYPASFRASETTRAVETRVSERGVARAIRVRCATTTAMRGEHRRGDDRVNPGDAPSPRCPLRKWDKWAKKPQHPVPAQKVVRRGRAGNARLHRPHGPYTRPTDRVDKIRRRAREIRDRTRWTRANIDVACRARLPGFQGKNRGECDEEGWPANGRKPSRELTCVACRLVDVREGTRVSNEGRLEACRLARCRQPRARGAQRSGFEGGGDVESKTKIPRELDRVASGVQSTVVFLCLQKPKTEIHRTVLSQSIIRPIT